MKCHEVTMILPNSVIEDICSLSKNLNIESKSEFVSRSILLCNKLYQSMQNGDRIYIEDKNGSKSEISLG